MCDFLRNCINKCLEFQIGFLIKFHQIINPNLKNEEPKAMYTSTIRLANQFIHSITYVPKLTAAESSAEAMSVYYADEYTEEEWEIHCREMKKNDSNSTLIDEEPKIEVVDSDNLHNMKDKDPNLKIEIHEMSMKDKTISDLKAIEEIRKCYENSLKGKMRKRIVKNNRKPLKTINELQEFSSEMVLDTEKDKILQEKEVYNKTGIC